MKTCNICSVEYPATTEYFYATKRVKSGLAGHCKVCHKATVKRTRDPEKHRKHLQTYREKNPEKVAAQRARASKRRSESGYYAQYYAKNKDRINARRNEWLRETGKSAEYVHRRRDRMNGETVTKADWLEVVSVYGNRCLVSECGSENVEMDHVIPLGAGGRNHISNLQPLCAHHNRAKAAKTVDYRPDEGKAFREVPSK